MGNQFMMTHWECSPFCDVQISLEKEGGKTSENGKRKNGEIKGLP